MKNFHAQPPVRSVAPAETPVSLTEVKAHLRVDHTDEDSTITIYLNAAVEALDGWNGTLGRCMVTQTWTQDWPAFVSGDKIPLPFPDVQSVTLAYTDTLGASQTLASSKYHLIHDHLSSALELSDGSVWPNTDDLPNAVRITMVSGYGAASDVPADLKAAILLHVGHMYENRESVAVGTIASGLPQAYEFLVNKHRRVVG